MNQELCLQAISYIYVSGTRGWDDTGNGDNCDIRRAVCCVNLRLRTKLPAAPKLRTSASMTSSIIASVDDR